MTARLRHVRSVADIRARHPDVRVVDPASDKPALLAAIYRALDAPAYAGANYDALADIVGDLGWLPPGPVRLVWTPASSLPSAVRAEVSEILTEAVAATAGTDRPLVAYLATTA